MLTSTQIFDQYCLEARRDLLEVAALLDRYDAALEREEGRDGNHSTQEAIEVFHNNPCRFLVQNPKWDIKPILIETDTTV
ncbi:MAG: hypothetical protein CMO47_07295 [Verrucomicrobiales bacterium]|nr:hypothetical protein [Verrucomicrobiales bacterium]|tara:strand:- start:10546 stop:10785 length:240 start_codon:yes stop_codon:yes gene_type:complete